MLNLNGLSFAGEFKGTVNIYAVPYSGRFPGATAQKRVVIETADVCMLLEDQILEGYASREDGWYADKGNATYWGKR